MAVKGLDCSQIYGLSNFSMQFYKVAPNGKTFGNSAARRSAYLLHVFTVLLIAASVYPSITPSTLRSLFCILDVCSGNAPKGRSGLEGLMRIAMDGLSCAHRRAVFHSLDTKVAAVIARQVVGPIDYVPESQHCSSIH
jgi:hypothetical protein